MKIIKTVIISTILIIFLCGCEKGTKKVNNENNTIDTLINQMTIEEKIGQLLIISTDNTYVDDKLSNIMNNVKPGGYILMAENYSSFDDTKKFISDLKNISDIPLIVATDEEGGIVQRMMNLTDYKPTDIPNMYEIGLTNDYKNAYTVGNIIANDLRTLGINMNLAPVIDLYSNPDNPVIGYRSFGGSTELVTNMALEYSKALKDNNIMSVYKHFPGHGDITTDPHYDLTILDKSYDELMENEFVPFKNVINNGAEMIMVGHIALPKITGDNTPASLSSQIINILKEDLKYDGLIITDSLKMKAILNNYDIDNIYADFINAGVDILLLPPDPERAIENIKENVSEERINESVKKILKYKYSYLNNYSILDQSYLNSEENQKLIEGLK